MQSGLILVDKPEGLSSAQVVSRVRRVVGTRRVGHAGTLDPLATGLLACLFGRATKLADFVSSGNKVYSGTIRLGLRSSTDDIQGEVLEERRVSVSDDSLSDALKSLTGELSQVPPQISAVKVNGKRAYSLSRQGQELELRPRQITVHSFQVERLSERELSFLVTCTKGTYVRSLARDLGELLGCGAVIQSLRRESSDPFSVKKAQKLEDLTPEHMLDWRSVIPELETVSLPHSFVDRLNGGDLRGVREELLSRHHRPGRLYAYAREKDGGELLENRGEGLLKFGEGKVELVVNNL